MDIEASIIRNSALGTFPAEGIHDRYFPFPFPLPMDRAIILIPIVSLAFRSAKSCFAWLPALFAHASSRPTMGKIADFIAVFSSSIFKAIRVNHDRFTAMGACSFYGISFHVGSISKYANNSKPKYFDIACRRIELAYQQPRLFEDEKPAAPKPQELGI